MARNVSTCVSGMGVNVPASMLPRSTSTPVILGQYESVQGVGPLWDDLKRAFDVIRVDPRTGAIIANAEQQARVREENIRREQQRRQELEQSRLEREEMSRRYLEELNRKRSLERARNVSVAPSRDSSRVDSVGIAPLVLLGLGALGLTGGLGFFAGRGSVDTAPSTLGGEIGKQVGSGLKWAALGFIGYTLISGKNPLKNLFKK